MLRKWRVHEIRHVLNLKYPGLNEPPEEEHPMAAAAVVLVSAAVISTTNVRKLVRYTGYDEGFILAVAFNMTWNKIWSESQYSPIELHRWFSPVELVIDGDALWEHIEVACACLWMPGIEPVDGPDPCSIYRRESKRVLLWTGPRIVQ